MCLKGKKTAPADPGNFRCTKCGATATKKDKGELCKPEKIAAAKKDKKPKKGK
jgi:hypothetical protein